MNLSITLCNVLNYGEGATILFSLQTDITSVSGPYPTNAWWTNLVLGQGDNPIDSCPYLLKALDSGLQTCYPSLTNSQNFIISTFLQNMSISCSQPIQAHYLTGYDLLSVTMQWSVDQERYIKSPIVRGSPYTTVQFANVTPVIGTQHAILSVNNLKSPSSCQGKKQEFSKLTANKALNFQLLLTMGKHGLFMHPHK